jgi:hypothetical protein
MAGSSYVIRDTTSKQDRVIKLHDYGDGDGTCSIAVSGPTVEDLRRAPARQVGQLCRLKHSGRFRSAS